MAKGISKPTRFRTRHPLARGVFFQRLTTAVGCVHARDGRGTGELRGAWWYAGAVVCRGSGQHGCALRVMPHNESLTQRRDAALIKRV